MKTRSFFFSFFSIIICVTSCSRKGDSYPVEMIQLNKVDTYPNKQLAASRFDLRDSLFYPINIWVVDTVLVMQTEAETQIFRLFSLSTGEKLKSFGSIGRAENEYLSPTMFLNDKENMIVYDRMKFDIVNIPALLHEEIVFFIQNDCTTCESRLINRYIAA